MGMGKVVASPVGCIQGRNQKRLRNTAVNLCFAFPKLDYPNCFLVRTCFIICSSVSMMEGQCLYGRTEFSWAALPSSRTIVIHYPKKKRKKNLRISNDMRKPACGGVHEQFLVTTIMFAAICDFVSGERRKEEEVLYFSNVSNNCLLMFYTIIFGAFRPLCNLIYLIKEICYLFTNLISIHYHS